MPQVGDYRYMAQALRLARRGLFTAYPNPRVGCVLTKDEQIIGEGFHERAGLAHAELNALEQAGSAAQGATAYVTLEPCCHYGRTPPCTQALIDARISRVVAAMSDPDPRVAGQGFAALRAAGIETDCGMMQAEAEDLNRGFISRMRRGRPWLRAKLAMSLDGRTALANGESRWISGEPARLDVQYLRARSSAIMTGGGTVRADNPALSVRLSAEELNIREPVLHPRRVILTAGLDIDPDAQVFNAPGECLIFAVPAARDRIHLFRRPNVEVVQVAAWNGGLDLQGVMRDLSRREISEVQVEAGATLTGALLRADLVDELVIYMAPALMGDSARGLVSLPALERMADRVPLRIQDIRMMGDDVRIIVMPVTSET